MLNENNFAIGLSKPLNIFNNELQIIKYSIEQIFFLHVSITYPVNTFIIKYLIKKKGKNQN